MKPEYRDRDADSLDAESLLSHNTSTPTLSSPSRTTRHRTLSTLTIIALLLTTHITIAIAASLLTTHWSRPTADLNSACARLTSHASPVTSNMDVAWAPVAYNGSFFHETIYRQAASPEVDAAWSALGVDYRPMRIAESEAADAGITVDHVKIREQYGGGHPGNLEGLHHLHCLNLLRQGLVYNYDYYKEQGKGAFSNEEPIVKYHITHCLDILRQQLMCTVDTGVLGQVWWNTTQPKPFVDFNTVHQCKNFDAIRQFAEGRQLPAKTAGDYLESPAGRVWEAIP